MAASARLGRTVGECGRAAHPWTYIRLMGADGLRRATEVAILSANHVARRFVQGLLDPLHRSRRSRSPRVHPRSAAVDQGDGDHGRGRRQGSSTTASRPDHVLPGRGTLMIEPTESESPGRARPVLRRTHRHPRRDRQGIPASGRWPTHRCDGHRTRPNPWSMTGTARTRDAPASTLHRNWWRTVLATGVPDRPGFR